MALKTIPLESVQVGMYLCGIDRAWLDTPFLIHRFLIASPADIDKLRQCGINQITIDTERGLDVPSEADSPATGQEVQPAATPPDTIEDAVPPEVARLQQLPPAVQGTSLAGELMSMKQARQQMLAGVEEILETLEKSGACPMEQVRQVTQSIMTETLGHEDACLVMIQTREYSPALYDHALSVSTLAVLLGRAVGLAEDSLQHLAMAGLLHDAGHLKIPQTLHRPLNELSHSQLAVYHTHPRRGVELLSNHSPLAGEVETIIMEHHVGLDGSGYPPHADPAGLAITSRILRIVDEYDELLSGHQTGTPSSVRTALQTLYQRSKKGQIDSRLVAAFISLIGIYPTYGLVELSTGERGIIANNSRENLLQPTILLIQDAAHRPLPEPIPLNFSVIPPSGMQPEIVQVLSPERTGIDIGSALEDWMTL